MDPTWFNRNINFTYRKRWELKPFWILYVLILSGTFPQTDTVNSIKIALVRFLRFFAFRIGRKIKIRND